MSNRERGRIYASLEIITSQPGTTSRHVQINSQAIPTIDPFLEREILRTSLPGQM